MGTVPKNDLDQITYFEEHLPIWTANAAQIGLLPAQVTAFSALVTAARNQFNAAQAIRSASKAQTVNFHIKLDAMNEGGSDLIRTIRAYADLQNDPTVFVKAEIPPPATPSPVGPPGTPTDYTCTLNPTGLLTIKWKCANPAGGPGTVYEVRRCIGPVDSQSVWTLLGTSGKREYTDTTLPALSSDNAAGVTYEVTAVRSTSRGQPSQYMVRFANGSAQGSQQSSASSQSGGENEMKIAA